MAKATVTKTFRLPEDVNDFVESNTDKSANQNIVDLLCNYKRVLTTSTNELRGKFTQDEWMFLADILNGTLVTPVFRCNKVALCAEIEDASEMSDVASKYTIDIAMLVNKVKLLTGAQLDALYTRVEEFWQHPDASLEDWANF